MDLGIYILKMSLDVLSEESIVKLYMFLQRDHIAKLMRCATRYAKISKENIELSKREALELRLIISRSEETEKLESVTVAVMWKTNGYGIIGGLRCRRYFENYKHRYYYITKKLNSTKTIEDAENILHKMVIKILKQVSIFSVLSIVGFNLKRILIDELHSSCSHPFMSLVIVDGKSTLNANELSILLQTFKPERLYMNGSARYIALNDLHMSQIPKSIEILDEWRFSHPQYPDIGDQTLTNWIYNTPEYVVLAVSGTNITLGGVTDFIKENVKWLSSTKKRLRKKAQKKREFRFGVIRSDAEMWRKFVLLQRTRGITFKQNRPNEYEIIYKTLEFSFKLRPLLRRITEEQARETFENITMQINERIAANPDFELWHDEDLYLRVEKIKHQMYSDWEEKYSHAHLLQLNMF